MRTGAFLAIYRFPEVMKYLHPFSSYYKFAIQCTNRVESVLLASICVHHHFGSAKPQTKLIGNAQWIVVLRKCRDRNLLSAIYFCKTLDFFPNPSKKAKYLSDVSIFMTNSNTIVYEIWMRFAVFHAKHFQMICLLKDFMSHIELELE